MKTKNKAVDVIYRGLHKVTSTIETMCYAIDQKQYHDIHGSVEHIAKLDRAVNLMFAFAQDIAGHLLPDVTDIVKDLQQLGFRVYFPNPCESEEEEF